MEKTVIITVADTVIGSATVIAFARNRVQVVIGDLSQDTEDTIHLIREEGIKSIFINTNVADALAVQNLANKTISNFGKIDFTFNSAGILTPIAPLAEVSETAFYKIIAVDLKRFFF